MTEQLPAWFPMEAHKMWIDRHALEEQEDRDLASFAQHSRDTRGRAYPSKPHIYRTEFQRDRERILHTTAFRRLEYKTQVFVNHEGDHYRTRLTHTLEVAQIARTIARTLRLNQDLTEAIALAHDLGHTPFGHSGEQALHEIMADKGGFNHNTQGLRIVETLEQHYPGVPGLNLTWEVREGIIKHATDYDTPEANAYEPGLRATLEAQIINLADEVAYNTHDLDDGLRSGLISHRQLRELDLWLESIDELGLNREQVSPIQRGQVIRHLVDREVTDIIHTTAERVKAAQPRSVYDIRKQAADLVAFSDTMVAHNKQLKAFLMTNLYRHWRVMRMHTKAQRVLQNLFDTYNQEPLQLPNETKRRAENDDLQRVICDYIAGMTDRFALQEYAKLFDPKEPV